MNALNNTHIANIGKLQTDTMPYICTIDTYSGSATDSFGQLQESWTSGSPTRCGINFLTSGAKYNADFLQVEADCIIRLPVDSKVYKFDKITTSGSSFSVIGIPRRGLTAVLVTAKRLEV